MMLPLFSAVLLEKYTLFCSVASTDVGNIVFAVVGEKAVIACRMPTSASFVWEYCAPGTTERGNRVMFYNGKYNVRSDFSRSHSVNNTNVGHGTISRVVIKDVQMQQAGTYICSQSHDQHVKMEYELQVLG